MENEPSMKEIFFEIFQAGYEQGFLGKDDIKTAYDKYWKKLTEEFLCKK